MIQEQRGVVSLITVTVMSLFILILTTGVVSQMNGEFRQGIDNENSTKSYYAAYSGLEETYAAISDQNAMGTSLTGIQQSCDHVGGASLQPFLPDVSGVANRGKVGLTCRSIQVITSNPTGKIPVDKVEQYNLTSAVGSAAIGRINIAWDDLGLPGGPGPMVNGDITSSNWGGSVPPVIVSIVSFPKDNVSSAVDTRSIILLPGTSGSVGQNFGLNSSINNLILTPVTCVSPKPLGTRRCKVNLINLQPAPNQDLLLRIRPLFKGIDYSISVFDSGGVPLKVVLPRIRVDVTASSGNSFTRLSNSIKVNSRPLSILDNVVFGNNSICKDFQILTDNGAFEKVVIGPGSGCPLDNGSQQ